MSRPTLTTDAGAAVDTNQHSQTAGQRGPVLLQDHHLTEKLARFNRERIPERVVHAVGSGAYGYFEVTHDVTRYTSMKMLSEVGKRTPLFARFSTVAASKGGVDTARDPRGFAVKFYTEDGNWNMVGNNTPIFFIRDGIKFPDFIHSQKYDPHTNKQEPDNVWDFFSRSPEATHMFVWLFGDRGRPASYRKMDGFGSHTFAWYNAAGERFWVKFHFKTEQGIDCLTDEAEAARIGGENPEHLQTDLYEAIEAGDPPSWSFEVQVMPEADALKYRFNPFDVTKVWSHEDYPRIKVGRMVLDETPANYFAHVEQAAFDPAEFVPGVGPSPDRMLQARLWAYGDAHRYRLGINHVHLPVNRPRTDRGIQNYGRDGFMNFTENGGGSANYEPNSRGGPVETGDVRPGIEVSGQAHAQPQAKHAEDDDFVQAGMLYRVMSEAERGRLVDRIAGGLSQVTIDGVVERSVSYFRKADADFGDRLEKAIAEKKGAAGR